MFYLNKDRELTVEFLSKMINHFRVSVELIRQGVFMIYNTLSASYQYGVELAIVVLDKI